MNPASTPSTKSEHLEALRKHRHSQVECNDEGYIRFYRTYTYQECSCPDCEAYGHWHMTDEKPAKFKPAETSA